MQKLKYIFMCLAICVFVFIFGWTSRAFCTVQDSSEKQSVSSPMARLDHLFSICKQMVTNIEATNKYLDQINSKLSNVRYTDELQAKISVLEQKISRLEEDIKRR